MYHVSCFPNTPTTLCGTWHVQLCVSAESQEHVCGMFVAEFGRAFLSPGWDIRCIIERMGIDGVNDGIRWSRSVDRDGRKEEKVL